MLVSNPAAASAWFAPAQPTGFPTLTPTRTTDWLLLHQWVSPHGDPLLHYALLNGHQVLLEPNDSEQVSLRTYVRAGSADEHAVYPSPYYAPNPFPSGIAHLDEHCHFLATQHFPEKNQWVNQVEQLGTRMNASTGYEEIQHELHFNREDLANMLQLHAEAVLYPLYNPQHIVQEKRNVINECSERMQAPNAIVYSKVLELMFDRPHFQSLGNRSDVIGTSADQLRQFYQQYYTPTNMLTVISGNINPEAVLPILNREFGQQRSPQVVAENPTGLELALKPHEIRTVTLQHRLLTSSEVALAFPAPAQLQTKDRLAMELLLHVLGDGLTSPLQKRLIDERHLANAVSMEMEPFKKTGLLLVDLTVDPGKEQAALQTTLRLLADAATHPVSEEALQQAKAKLTQAYRHQFTTPAQRTAAYGAALLHHTLDDLLTYPEQLQRITAQDLQKVAATYLTPDRYVAVFAQPGSVQASSPKQSTTDGTLPNYEPEGSQVSPLPPAKRVQQPGPLLVLPPGSAPGIPASSALANTLTAPVSGASALPARRSASPPSFWTA